MSLLVDNQLPVALARYLDASGWKCIHVRDVELEEASDDAIWEYAKARHLTIITKDEDFEALANRQGSIPPQVVWVRLGNCRKFSCTFQQHRTAGAAGVASVSRPASALSWTLCLLLVLAAAFNRAI
jgi:predicted nuclease of predicted toxin-antitoxin system